MLHETISSRWEEDEHTVLAPLYTLFSYFSASLMHWVWLLYSAGELNVVEQSMQSKPE